eukprot:6879766-Prymnesium_polylepis.1
MRSSAGVLMHLEHSVRGAVAQGAPLHGASGQTKGLRGRMWRGARGAMPMTRALPGVGCCAVRCSPGSSDFAAAAGAASRSPSAEMKAQ